MNVETVLTIWGIMYAQKHTFSLLHLPPNAAHKLKLIQGIALVNAQILLFPLTTQNTGFV